MPATGQELRRWQLERLQKLGYAHPDAQHLIDLQVDVRELEKLVRAGCSLALAVRILA